MNKKIPNELRKRVIDLSGNHCEYCLLPDEDSYYGFQIDHIVSRKHGGKTNLQNLAYSCPDCNRYKGSDLGTYLHNHPDRIIERKILLELGIMKIKI